MSDFQPGEIVDITIKGVRIVRPRSATAVTIIDEHDIVYQMPPQAAVARVAPPDWPPQLGDLWRDAHGSVWFALGRPRLLMVPGDPVGDLGGYEPNKVLAKVGPLTLVHREDKASES